MKVKTELYLILYHSKALKIGNNIDYKLPPIPPPTFYHRDLTPLPKLDLPIFIDRFSHMATALRKLGYVVAKSIYEPEIRGLHECEICDCSLNSYTYYTHILATRRTSTRMQIATFAMKILLRSSR
jgi:hypothetical protein